MLFEHSEVRFISVARAGELRTLLAGSTALCLGCLGAPAFAQAAPAPAPAPATSSSLSDSAAPVSGLEDIVVTARKRSESVQNVPVAVTAFSPAVLQRYDLSNIQRIAASTPSLLVGPSGGHGSGASFTIRGIGASPLATGIEQDVATIVDGSYYGFGRVVNDGFFDLGGVEILKGPQALFFGKNATAGVVSIKTADPGSKPEAMVRAGYEFNAREAYAEGVYSTPLTDTLGIRGAVRVSKQFGALLRNAADPQPYTTFDAATGTLTTHPRGAASKDQPGDRQVVGRVTLKWAPTDKLTDTLKIYGSIYKNNGPYGGSVFQCAPGRSTYQLDPTRPCVGKHFVTFQENLPKDLGDTRYFRGGQPYLDYKSYAVNNEFKYDLGQATLTSVTNFNHSTTHTLSDDSGTDADISQSFTATYFRYRAFSNETRVQTQYDGPINALLGVYYQKTNFLFDEVPQYFQIDNSAAPADLRYSLFDHVGRQRGETISGFGQLIWKVVPTVEVTGGVRYIHETKKSLNSQANYVNPILTGIFLPVSQPQSQTFTNWSPEATIAWKPTADINVYGSYKTAYKSGGYGVSANLVPGALGSSDPAPAASLSFGPETVKGFEAGVKTTLFDRQLRFNVAAYRYHYNNLQLQYFNGAALSFNIVTANATNKGIEVDTEFAPNAVRGLTFTGSLNYNKATYTRFQAPCFNGESFAEGCSLGTAFAPQQDLRGSTLPNAPRWTAALGSNYEASIGDNYKMEFGAQSRYSSRYNVSPLLATSGDQRRYVNLDATVGLRTVNDEWEISLIGKNLTNHFVKLGINDVPGTGAGTGTAAALEADTVAIINPPRTVQIQLTWRM